MHTSALIMMIVSIFLLWGGLILALWHLIKNPDEQED